VKCVVLENIRSAHNVGSVFRTADGAGVDEIFLVGYTPAPIDRFGRMQKEIQKTSLGASEWIPWRYFETVAELVAYLEAEAIVLVAVEIASQSISLKQFKVPDRVAYVLGNEVEGVSEAALKAAATIVDIPMLGKKESLNVSVTAGIVLYHDVV